VVNIMASKCGRILLMLTNKTLTLVHLDGLRYKLLE
jgi:hypothetical protein